MSAKIKPKVDNLAADKMNSFGTFFGISVESEILKCVRRSQLEKLHLIIQSALHLQVIKLDKVFCNFSLSQVTLKPSQKPGCDTFSSFKRISDTEQPL